MVELLGPLSARPPTPPRTASRMLPEKDRMEDSPVTVQTPIDSPLLPNGSTGAPSGRQSKRVNFSPWTKYIKPPTFTNTISKALLPSSESKPAKSILKSTNSPGPVSLPGITSHTPETFAMLLESITQQLAGESTSAKIDAYMQFFGALRAYEKLPPEDEIVRKIGLVTRFIQRDVDRDLAKGGPLDTNIVIQALKLSVVLVWHPQISPHLPDDFKLFLIEHSVSALEDGKLPKSVLTHYLSVLSTQKFHARIVTNARATRMLTVLHNLTDRVKGNAIVTQRLMIYERIFEQAKSTFVSHAPLWMDHLISGLLHHIKDVRLKAMELGFNVYMAVSPNPTLSKTLRDIFDRPLDNNRKLASEICERMSRMMANPESAEHVPQIWGVIILLLRSKRFSIDQWQHFKEWVLVLQKCFNCSDPEVKSKAFGNWNRFVLAVNISETTSQSLLRMLSKPILSQFERKKQEKQRSQPSQLVVASYYNLLYYAFRPSTSYQQLDIVWEEYIALPSSNIFTSVPSLSDRVSQALSNLLWSSQPKGWSENRVNEPKRIVPEELPSLDCKWIRSRIAAVLKVFEDILRSSLWAPDMDKSNVAVAWLNLSQALAYASSKEITPSPESMQAVAHVLGLLQRLWNAGPSSLNAVGEGSMDTFFERFRFLSTTMIVALGSIPFTEKLLLKTADATYQTANTPTHRHSRGNNNLDSPILHFLRLVSDVSGISAPTTSYIRLIKDTLEAACNGKFSRGSRLEVLRQCADLYPSENELHFGFHDFAQIVWRSTAQLSADCLCSLPTESARERDGSVSRDYENVVTIISAGLKFSDIFQVWDQLIDAFFRVLRTEKGDRAIVTMALEPLADFMAGLDVRNTYRPASSLFNRSLSLPFLEQDAVAVSEQKGDVSTLLFPHELVGLAHQILQQTYEKLDPLELNGVAVFVESLTSFLGSGAPTFRSTLLDKLQRPLALYLKDASRKLTVESGVERRILTACRALSSAVLNILQGVLPHDTSTLERFEHIICSGLGSSHISIAKRFGDFWSSTFGSQDSLHCPKAVSEALQKLETQINNPTSSRRLPVEGSQDGAQNNPLGSEGPRTALDDMWMKSRIAFILDAPPESSYSALLDSSPVTKGSESTTASLQPSKAPQAPQHAQPENLPESRANTDEVAPSLSGKEGVRRHSDVFSMIDDLRSSSPITNMPQHNFMTPPHLHSLRNGESGTETPQTPTIPVVSGDIEDPFLGSSPTPGIRGRTQSVASEMPATLSTAGGDSRMDIDPPSSPPESALRSSNSRHSSPSHLAAARDKVVKNRKKRNRSKRSRLADKEKSGIESTQSDRSDVPDDNRGELSMGSRLRSAIGQVPAKDEDAAAQQARKSVPRPTSKESSNGSAVNSASGPKNDMPRANPKNAKERFSEQDSQISDSCSDDMDTQVTSQLEHDLVSAVDLDGSAASGEAAGSSLDQPPITRKRKREAEVNASTHSEKERRRSSRLSSVTIPAEIEESLPARSKKQKVSAAATHNTPVSSPASSVVRGRKHEAEIRIKTPKQEHRVGKDRDNAKGAAVQENSSKRRSSRISGLVAPDIPDDSPVDAKSPRSHSSRKQNKKKQRDGRSGLSQSQTSEQAAEQGATATVETPHKDQHSGRETSTKDTSTEQQPKPEKDIALQQTPSKPTYPMQPNPPQTHPAQATGPSQPSNSNEIQLSEVQGPTTNPSQANPESQIETPTTSSSRPAQTEAPVKQETPKVSITGSLRKLVDEVKFASSLDRNTVREIDDLLFDLRFEMHEALRRHRGCES